MITLAFVQVVAPSLVCLSLPSSCCACYYDLLCHCIYFLHWTNKSISTCMYLCKALYLGVVVNLFLSHTHFIMCSLANTLFVIVCSSTNVAHFCFTNEPVNLYIDTTNCYYI